MVDTWVVVADGSRCRIFASDASLAELQPVKELQNKHHVGDHRGHPNRGHDSAHHGIESKFAAEIGAELTQAVQSHAVRDLLLVAPSRFLGDLLAALPKATAGHVTGRLAKDYTAFEIHELARRLREALVDNHDLH